MSDIILSPTQMSVAEDVLHWYTYGDQPTYTVAGYAGTGKTTLARFIEEAIDGDTLFCAFTGKAASVLSSKGCEYCSTIHAAIYVPRKKKGGKANEDGEDDPDMPAFFLDKDLARIKNFDLIVVDEYSMLGEKLRADLESFGKKILYLGDPFQLPPINGFNYIEPDAMLTDVHRQALESPILKAATDVREGIRLKLGDYGDFKYIMKSDATSQMFFDADQVIVGKNATRKNTNDWFRKKKDFHHPLPRKGDKMICLKNNAALGLFNGMIGTSTSDAKKGDHRHYRLYFDGIEYPVWIESEDTPPPEYLRQLERFGYGYAITCHKSQGSEFENVLLLNEALGDDEVMRRRWIYTGITRASKKLIMVQPK